jgi:hypothetical protein
LDKPAIDPKNVVVPSRAKITPGRWRELVAALQNRVVQIGRVRFARVERHPDVLRFWISDHFFHAVDFHQRPTQTAHALVAVVALRRDIDPFQDRSFIGAFEIMRVRWVHDIRSRLGPKPGASRTLAGPADSLASAFGAF